MVVLPETHVLDLSGPVQVFDEANGFGAAYAHEYVGLSDRVVTAQGLEVAGLKRLPKVQPGDLVIVPGTRLHALRPASAALEQRFLHWLREAHEAGAKLASVCSGAVAFLEAGLLDGRRYTTHWSLFDTVRHAYGHARLVEDALFVTDGPITTSAGIASGIDMALALVERDHGPILTARVARELVVYLRRDGSAGQTSVYLEHRTHLHMGVHRVQDHLVQHANEKAKLEDLARLAGLSPRGLSGAFKRSTGLTPLEYQQRLRLELVRHLMTDRRLTLEAIAERCGFDDARQLRRLWRDRFHEPLSSARRRTA